MSIPLEYDVTLPDGHKYKQPSGLFINNEFVKPKSGKTIESINPDTGKVNGYVYAAEEEEVDLAVKCARQAFKKVWKKVTGVERGQLLYKLAEAIEKNRELLSAMEAWDSGKVKRNNAVYDVDECIDVLKYYAGWADKIKGNLIQNDSKKVAYTVREPYGVCGQIIPWNYPLAMAVWKIAPAVATGNVVVLKSSELTPMSLLYFATLVKEVGFPAGVINILSGYGAVCGKALASHLDVDKVAFTGSTQTGKLIQQLAAVNLKAVTLECGGKSPMIVRHDADLDETVPWAAMGVMSNLGQICSATSRIYIHEKVYDTFVEKLAKHVSEVYLQGDVFDDKAVVGPQVSKQQYEKVINYLDLGKSEGARVVLGGAKNDKSSFANGYYIQPTIFADVSPEMKIVNEEIFGPVVTCAKYNDDEKVVEEANNTMYGLGASVFTKDLNVAHQMASDIESGTVWINSSNDNDCHIPFGGVKMSGTGRELGEDGIATYTQAKAININLGMKL